MDNIILASGSPRRKELLEQIGIDPIIMPSKKEEICKAKSPVATVRYLSKLKAEDIASIYSDSNKAIVIGADTVVACDGEILGKPKDIKDAIRMLILISGRKHQVYTGVTIIKKGDKSITFFVKTDVNVYTMTLQEIKDYISKGESMDKAGAYGIQGSFAAYIESIKGDYTNVVGLPLGRLYKELKNFI